MIYLSVAAAICLIAALAGVFLLGRWVAGVEGQLAEHQRQLRQAQDNIEEILSGRRHPENVVAGIEDLLAVLMRIMVEEDMQAKSRSYWIGRAQAIAQQLRVGPRAYPVDGETGPRLVTYLGNRRK